MSSDGIMHREKYWKKYECNKKLIAKNLSIMTESDTMNMNMQFSETKQQILYKFYNLITIVCNPPSSSASTPSWHHRHY